MLLIINYLLVVEAAGVGLWSGADSKQVIDFKRRTIG